MRLENQFIPPRMEAAPGGPGAGPHPRGRNPFAGLNRRPLPPGMNREERQGPNDELLFVQAEPPAVEDIRNRFNRHPPDPNNYTGFRRWLLERRLVQRAVQENQRSRTLQDVVGVALLTGLLVLGGTIVTQAIIDAQNTPHVTRVNLDPMHCYNAPEGSVAMGYNLSIDGQVLGTDPNTGIVVLLEPDQNPLTQTKQVCSGSQPAAIDIVQGDGSVLLSTFANDQLSLMQTGCVDNKGCANIIPLRR